MALRLEFICSVFVVLSLTALLGNSTSTGWWSLGLSGCADKGGDCENCATLAQNGLLDNQQKELCTNNGNGAQTVPVIARGTRNAILECQKQFSGRKWNCSTFLGNYPFGSFAVEKHTRETAALFGYLTAGATQALAEACHDQRILNCPCITSFFQEDEEGAESILRVCNENTVWAIEYIRNFLSGSSSSDPDVGEMCDQKNIEVATDLVAPTEKFCRCHGVSGTCSVQTCYDKATSLSEVSEILSTRYRGAVQVVLTNNTLERAPLPNAEALNSTHLCYVDNSPSFCNPNSELGILGTANRLCELTDSSPNSCDALCCGRGHYTTTHTEPITECRFVYCCRIECEEVGTKVITETRCSA